MRSAHVTRPDGPELLALVQVATHGPGEVLIHVAAAEVNGPDVRQRCGLHPPPRRCSFADIVEGVAC
jgi:NADPH:quinone reductase